MMRHLAYLLSVFLCLLAGRMVAQPLTPEAYFDKAARDYVKVDKGTALRILDKALREHPGDPRLLKLAEELLKDESPDEQEQQQQQQEEPGEGEGQQQRNQEQAPPEQKKDRPEPGRISPKDAERILDAMEREEKEVRDRMRDRERPAARKSIDKDW